MMRAKKYIKIINLCYVKNISVVTFFSSANTLSQL